MIALQKVMTDQILPPLEDITPGSGAYMNEVRWLSIPISFNDLCKLFMLD